MLLGSSIPIRVAPPWARARQTRYEPLRVAEGDDHALGLGHDAADPPEVVGERGAERVRPARIAVAELGVGHLRERCTQRPEPRRSRKGREARAARAEVETQPRRRGSGSSRRRSRRRPRSARRSASALAEIQVPLGGELGVRLDHDSPRDTELAGEVARRRQLRPVRAARRRGSRAGADPRSARRACVRSDPAPPRSAARRADWSLSTSCQQRVYTCTSGPYHRATATVDQAVAGCVSCSPRARRASAPAASR